ncbi:MAG TPA: D-glycerate dehydrogenase [Planctomycetaceae bacterium]|nr:D-glycerate dehydrogenase [Planctomycetaceae bacterium]HRE99304.1 D-glycerate dehydrogenase [Pirellulaceae bacterium]
MSAAVPLPEVLADAPDPMVRELVAGRVRFVPWESGDSDLADRIVAIYTYGHPRVDAALLDRFPRVKVVSNYGVGVDHIDLAAAQARRIPVGNTPGILDGATADQAWTLLLAAARRLIEGDRFARGPDFLAYDPSRMWGTEVHGSTIGIVGMGRIGREIARRAVGFSMRSVYHNRRPLDESVERFGAEWLPLDDLLRQADFVVLACPLSDATRGLIGARELGLMKSTAILVNIARGGVVDTEALTAALADRSIAAAGLDVTEPEPLPRDHRLLSLANVVIAPHLGSATGATRRRMAEGSVANLLAGLAGSPLANRVV